jgi:hypothetical protein
MENRAYLGCWPGAYVDMSDDDEEDDDRRWNRR